MTEINGYTLSRQWFDFAFENPEKIRPIHGIIYLFSIEHCNRLGWKDKFGFPTTMAMEAIGVKKYQTYIKAFNELVDWGFIKLIQKSKNQYSANIINIKSAYTKNGKALDKAFIKHGVKQLESMGQSKDSINKQVNKEQRTKIEAKKSHPLLEEIKAKYKNVGKLKSQLTYEEAIRLENDFEKEQIDEKLLAMENYAPLAKKSVSVNLTIRNWMKRDGVQKKEGVGDLKRLIKLFCDEYSVTKDVLQETLIINGYTEENFPCIVNKKTEEKLYKDWNKISKLIKTK